MSIPEQNKNAPEDLVVGQIIDGRYRVLEIIGIGGMGTVYRVEQLMLKREYALKTLNSANMSEVSWMRFQKEARAANILDHPHLVKVHDIGVMEGRLPYILMDYCDGITLAQRLKQGGPMPLAEALPLFTKVCLALGYAHSKGVVHRDIKPSNIIISPVQDADGVPELRIVDFGIAKLVNLTEGESLALTKTGEVFGTPFYMSPEQCLGERTDARSDIYSLGCVLYEALTGTPPLLGENALSTMMKHQSETPLPLKEASLGISFPDAMAIVLGKMIEKKPDARYQKAEEVADDFKKISQGQPVALAPKLVVDGTVNGARHSLPLFLIGGVALATCLLGVFWLGRISSQHSSVPSPQIAVSGAAEEATKDALKSVVKMSDQPNLVGNDLPSPDMPPPMDQHFSTWRADTPSTRYFRFPPDDVDPDRLVGSVLLDEGTKVFRIQGGQLSPVNSKNNVLSAVGNIVMQNFRPLGIRPSMAACDDVSLLKQFRSSEIDNLDFYYQMATSDKTIEGVAALFPYVRKLSVNATGNMRNVLLTDNAVKYFDRFNDLVELDIGESRISSKGLAKMKRLRQLKVLKTAKIVNPQLYLKALRGSRRLEHLELARSEQTDDAAGLIATLPELDYLDISQSFLFTDKGVADLAPLSNLHSLFIHGCKSVTPACIPDLKKLKRLRLLTVSYESWSREDQDRLHAALPDCQILNNYPEAERLESPNK